MTTLALLWGRVFEPTASLRPTFGRSPSQGDLPIASAVPYPEQSRTCEHPGLSRIALPVGVFGHRRSSILEGLEPSSPPTNARVGARGAVSWPLDHQCLSPSVALVGIEPTSSGLRNRCITLSATVPNQSARWESNPGPGRCVL